MAGVGGSAFSPPPGPSSDPLATFLHWVWYGKAPGAGLGAVPGEFLSSIDPRSRAGLVNIASMFAGGPRGEEILGPNFEPYSLQKAMTGNHVTFREGNKLQGLGGGRIHGSIGETLGHVEGRNSMRSDPQRVFSEHLNEMFGRELRERNAVKQSKQQAFLRQEAARRVQLRNKVNDHLGAEPARFGHELHRAGTNPMEHDYFDAPEFEHLVKRGGTSEPRIALVRRLLQRRYQAQLGHNHN